MFKRQGIVGPAAATLLAAAIASPALASERADAAPVMPLGARMAGPAGLFDFCTRDPETCMAARAETPEQLETLRFQARQNFWRAAFGMEPADEAPPAAVDAPAVRAWVKLTTLDAAKPAAPTILSAATSAPAPGEGAPAAADAAADPAVAQDAAQADGPFALAAGDMAVASEALASETTPVEIVGETSATPAFAFDRAGWALINRINRTVNRDIGRITDPSLYGVADYWAAPSGAGAQGDCEDFVLAKRQALIEAGVPASVLSIAIVETRWGETHAVLLVAGDRGEFVLDNLSPWVSRWDRVGYRWRSRQSSASLFDWARLDI